MHDIFPDMERVDETPAERAIRWLNGAGLRPTRQRRRRGLDTARPEGSL